MLGPTEDPGGAPAGPHAATAAVARGGALNLVGAIVYGAANFGLLVVLNRTLGTRSAGIVLVAIAIFNIVSTVAGLGCSTGLIRMISRDRAIERTDRLRATVLIGVVPVAVISVALSVAFFLGAAPMARVLGDSDTNTRVVADILRGMAVFLPFSALHTVIISGTRGFDTMRPQVMVERIGRALSLPLVVAVAVAVGMGPIGVGIAWAATNVVALGFSVRAMQVRVRSGVAASGRAPVPVDRAPVPGVLGLHRPSSRRPSLRGGGQLDRHHPHRCPRLHLRRRHLRLGHPLPAPPASTPPRRSCRSPDLGSAACWPVASGRRHRSC